MRRAGFTLIEIIMVIVLLGVMAAVLVVGFSTFYNVKLDGAAAKLAADMRYCQQLAMHRNGTYAVVFEPGASRYTLYYLNGSTLTDIPDPITHTAPARTTYGTGDYTGISLVSASFNGGQELRFTPKGVPQDSNGNDLSSSGTAVISSSAGSQTVSVTPDTGLVTVS